MNNAADINGTIERIVSHKSKTQFVPLIYLIFNIPLSAVMLLLAGRDMYRAAPFILQLNVTGLVYGLIQLFMGLIAAGALVSCAGVYLRKEWGRIMVIAICSLNIAVFILSAVLIGRPRSLLIGAMPLGSLFWLIVFIRARFDFMNSDALRSYLRSYYSTHADKYAKKCINCESWDGSRTPDDEHCDAMCNTDAAYHKGNFVCASYFPRLR